MPRNSIIKIEMTREEMDMILNSPGLTKIVGGIREQGVASVINRFRELIAVEYVSRHGKKL